MQKQIMAFGLLLSVLLSLGACAPQNAVRPTYEESEYTDGSWHCFVYEDMFYYIVGGTLYFCPVEYLEARDDFTQPLCFDPMCTHKGSRCPAFIGYDSEVCLRNVGGKTWLFAYSSQPAGQQDDITDILKYDISSGQKATLVKEIPNPIDHMIVTDEYIFYEERAGSAVSLRTYSFKDDKVIAQQKNDNNKAYRLIGFENDTLYYSADECVYSNSVTFDNEQLLFVGEFHEGYTIRDGYLYFPMNLDMVNGHERSFRVGDVARTPLSAPSKDRCEILASSVLYATRYKIFDNILYYLPCDARYAGVISEVIQKGTDGLPDQKRRIINSHNGTVMEVNLDTLERGTTVEELGYTFWEMIHFTPERLIFSSTASGYRTDIPFNSFKSVFVYERDTEKMYSVLYYGPDYDFETE